jgi:hypothetical protein
LIRWQRARFRRIAGHRTREAGNAARDSRSAIGRPRLNAGKGWTIGARENVAIGRDLCPGSDGEQQA